ncbi:hypothetical protein BCV70DRAFT_205784 [Testicularia cyperi]|uniref:Uncharacterized protein n=1 Tax=Testicularia cyperi TaxID=1882483 RepID=A0A317XTS7_9BASI|nr:hypothetical protein BCV70DRAFT_205784 [Testicularia cyperi]
MTWLIRSSSLRRITTSETLPQPRCPETKQDSRGGYGEEKKPHFLSRSSSLRSHRGSSKALHRSQQSEDHSSSSTSSSSSSSSRSSSRSKPPPYHFASSRPHHSLSLNRSSFHEEPSTLRLDPAAFEWSWNWDSEFEDPVFPRSASGFSEPLSPEIGSTAKPRNQTPCPIAVGRQDEVKSRRHGRMDLSAAFVPFLDSLGEVSPTSSYFGSSDDEDTADQNSQSSATSSGPTTPTTANATLQPEPKTAFAAEQSDSKSNLATSTSKSTSKSKLKKSHSIKRKPPPPAYTLLQPPLYSPSHPAPVLSLAMSKPQLSKHTPKLSSNKSIVKVTLPQMQLCPPVITITPPTSPTKSTPRVASSVTSVTPTPTPTPKPKLPAIAQPTTSCSPTSCLTPRFHPQTQTQTHTQTQPTFKIKRIPVPRFLPSLASIHDNDKNDSESQNSRLPVTPTTPVSLKTFLDDL